MQLQTYADRCRAAQAQLLSAREKHDAVGLNKSTSNLFRQRRAGSKKLLDLQCFDHVIHVDAGKMVADVEGMTTYETLVEATLRKGLLPAVVPELKTITVGGAVSGLGIESSSFRFGLVHETVEEMDVLPGSGKIVTCAPAAEDDLFYAMPNSYGTLGYALRLRIRLIPAPTSIHLRHRRFTQFGEYFRVVSELAGDSALNYLDGTIFSSSELFLTTGQACAYQGPFSDYSGMRAYYQSIPRKSEDWLSARSYIWRWDTDWFWCSRQFHLDHPLLRFLMLPALGSLSYQRLMRLSHHLFPPTTTTESVIQDVQIPVERAAEFAEFVLSEVGITPVWICPFRSFARTRRFDFCPLDPDRLYVNFGFWDVVPARGVPGCVNRAVEREARELGGTKGLYSSNYYDESTFWEIYDKDRYEYLRRKYQAGIFPDLFSKCVLRS